MKENLMPHNAHPTRRTILTGAAWALPIIAASAAVPAYAANGAQTGTSHTIKGQANGRKTVKTFTVPAGVHELSFTLTGGAGGTVMTRSQGGCGAKVTGTVSVTPGATVEIGAAAGGIGVLERVTRNGASWNESKPATGGEGYGKGGSSAAQVTVPAGPKAIIDAANPRTYGNPTAGDGAPHTHFKRSIYAASGGGSSALLVNGTVVAIAAGGGGGHVRNSSSTAPLPGSSYAISPVCGLEWVRGGSGGNAEASMGYEGAAASDAYSVEANLQIIATPGTGGSGGRGGMGAIPNSLPTGDHGLVGFGSQNKQVIHSTSAAGATGGNGFNANGADGVGAYAYQYDKNDPANLTGTATARTTSITISKNFFGYQTVVSAGGGAGYGGGGSGVANAVSAIIISQQWCNNPKNPRRAVGYVQQGGAGGAGGSYLAPSVRNGAIVGTKEAPAGPNVRVNGMAEVRFK